MPNPRAHVLPDGPAKAFAQQVARDIQVSIIDSINAVSHGRPVVHDAVARVVTDHLGRQRSAAAVGPRSLRVARLATRALAEHARTHGLKRVDAHTPVLTGRSAAHVKRDYAWAARSLDANYAATLGAALGVPSATAAAAPTVTYSGLTFRVRAVQCVDETGAGLLGEAGNDEIRMGATLVDALGVVSNYADFKVADFAQDGVRKTYDPPKVLHRFPIDPAVPFPQKALVFVHLAEADMGGFGAFMSDFYDAIQGFVVSIMVNAGISLGATIGASIGSLGGPVGMIVGAIVGFVLGLLVGWLIGALEDDVFDPQMAAVMLPSATADFGGATTAQEATLTYEGHDGKYTVEYDWVLSV